MSMKLRTRLSCLVCCCLLAKRNLKERYAKRRNKDSMKLAATVKEAVADV